MNLCELLLLSNPTVAHPPTHVVASIVFNYESHSCPCVSRASTYVCTNIFSLAQQRHHKRGYCWLGSPEHLPATSVLLFIINHTWTLRYDNNFHTTKLLLLLLIRLANVCFVLCSLKHVLCFINWSERHPSTSTRSRYLRAGGSLRQLDRVLANGSRQQYRLDSWQCTTTGCP